MKKKIFFLGICILLISIGTLLLSTTITSSLNPYNVANKNSKSSLNELPRMAQDIAWNANGNPICMADEAQSPIRIISDGAGGAIITWEDDRNTDTDIYAQHIDSDGNVQWGSNGIEICTADETQDKPEICSDGAGGAIITWEDRRNGIFDIYAQHINSNGVVQWGSNGIAICTADEIQSYPKICSDGAGGAIITWEDERDDPYADDIYAQHINSNGVVQWGSNGIVICDADDDQWYPIICSDGAGGAIITWQDRRNGNFDIYAQYINQNGIIQWIEDGRPICTDTQGQYSPKICSDGAGGAIIAWEDLRNGNYDIYVQQIDSNGQLQWMNNGIGICTATGSQDSQKLCSDGAGGAIITWEDYRDVDNDVYAQRISSDGQLEWVVNGVAICTATDTQGYPDICSDGAGGAVICWNDYRSGDNWDSYAQHINSSGSAQWVSNGLGICTLDEDQGDAVLSSDGEGNIIIAWIDRRNGDDWDVYAQKITVPIPDSSINGYSVYFLSLSICIIVLIFTIRVRRKNKLIN
ncbi:MAG: hypothetical protein ACFFCE_17520 [Promethearchaeota archaeon]